MAKINCALIDKNYKKENAIGNYELRKKRLVPILKDGKLFIYKINNKDKFSELLEDYVSNLFDIYNDVQLNTPELRSDLHRSSYLSFFENLINYHQASAKELYDCFYLSDEKRQKDFLEKYAQEVVVKVPIDNEIYTKAYRNETLEELLERIAPSYLVCVFKRPSKISALMSMIEYYNYFNLDFIASSMCEFFNLGDVKFSSNKISILEHNEDKVTAMSFSNKEKELSNDDKIAIVREIYKSLNIKCIYCEEIDKISNSQLNCIANYKYKDFKDVIINIAKHNNDILENSAFSDIFNKIKSRSRVLKK